MIEPWPYLLAVLAAIGGAWAISEDSITERPRAWISRRGWIFHDLPPATSYDEYGLAAEASAELTSLPNITPIPGRAAVRWLWMVLDCPYCIGWWCSLAATAVALEPDLVDWRWWLSAWAVRGGHLAGTAVIQRVKPTT